MNMIFTLKQLSTSRKVTKFAFFLILVAFVSIICFSLAADITIFYYSHFKNQRLNVSQFVGFHVSISNGRRLGNQIFALAAVIYVAQLTGRKPVLQKSDHMTMEEVFELNLERLDDICPCFMLRENPRMTLSYEEDSEERVLKGRLLSKQSILVGGSRQSWKYTRAVDRRLRRHLVFREDIRNVTETFLESVVPDLWKHAGFVRVGIHARRGDIVSADALEGGYTVPDESYFRRAMDYFIERNSRVQFIVASDDFDWVRKHIIVDRYAPDTINITYSFNHTAGQDMALLSMCDHVIMSTGTYGWWSAWLAKGTTIYYSDWPRKGSVLYSRFKKEDFFPPHWIPMSG